MASYDTDIQKVLYTRAAPVLLDIAPLVGLADLFEDKKDCVGLRYIGNDKAAWHVRDHGHCKIDNQIEDRSSHFTCSVHFDHPSYPVKECGSPLT